MVTISFAKIPSNFAKSNRLGKLENFKIKINYHLLVKVISTFYIRSLVNLYNAQTIKRRENSIRHK